MIAIIPLSLGVEAFSREVESRDVSHGALTPDAHALESSLAIRDEALADMRRELAEARSKLEDATASEARAWTRVKLLEQRLANVANAAQGK